MEGVQLDGVSPRDAAYLGVTVELQITLKSGTEVELVSARDKQYGFD